MSYQEYLFHPTASHVGTQEVYSEVYDLGGFRTLAYVLEVNVITGTSPTLTITFETSMDGRIWRTLLTVSPVSAAGQYSSNTNDDGSLFLRYLRAKQEIAGTSGDVEVTYGLRGISRGDRA